MRLTPNEWDTTLNAPLESFYVTMNCKTGLGEYPYPNTLTNSTKYSYDNTNKEVTVSYGSESYKFPAAVFIGSQTVKVTQKGIYRVTEVKKWSSTDYDFWDGTNIYKDTVNNRIAVITDKNLDKEPYVAFLVADVDTEKADRSSVSFTNTETEYAYLSAQAYAENTIKRNNS